MITIKPIKTSVVFNDENSYLLLLEYANECSIPQIGHYNPQPLMYEAMEQMDLLQCFGVYSDEKLVGFCNVMTTVLPHYGKRVATIESIFIASAERKLGAGKMLIDAVDAYAKEAGCVAILYSAPASGQLEKVLSLTKDVARTNAVFCRSLQ